MTAETVAGQTPALDRDEALVLARTLDELAAMVTARANEVRAAVDEQMRAEFKAHRSVATWRASMGTIVGQLSQTRIDVADEDAFVAHVGAARPTEVVEKTVRSVRPAYHKAYLDGLQVRDGLAVDPGTGEIVPGLSVRPGGEYRGVQLRPNDIAKQAAVDSAEELFAHLELPQLGAGGES